AVGTSLALVFLYWLYAGGMTLRFNLSDPGEVIPVPVAWLSLLIIAVVSQVILHLLVLRRNRVSVGSWLAQTVLEVFVVICLYFAVLSPGFERIYTDNPTLITLLGSAPKIIAVGLALVTLVSKGSKLVKLWNYRNTSTLPFIVKTDG